MFWKMEKMKLLLKNETVFCVSLVLALLSMLAVHPDKGYLAYPDYRTLALLFCLMIIVAGFQSLGVFAKLGQALLRRAGSRRELSAVLVLLCFFSSMVITNAVTLLTFVPFTMLVFGMVGWKEQVVRLVVLETIAANLGSMATPIGNPQNLYLYSMSGITAGEFAFAVLPYAGLSLVLLLAAVLAGADERLPEGAGEQQLPEAKKRDGGENAGEHGGVLEESGGEGGGREERLLRRSLPFLLLLLLCLLVVFRVLPYPPVLCCVAAAVLLLDRKLYRSVDYFLLLTFLCFFVFIGNIKRIPEVSSLLVAVVDGRELLTGILASQVISNVPAAILLAGFTRNFTALLTGVNLGGLGTLIASLASLISFKLYTREYPAGKGRFLKVFTAWNLAFLLALVLEAALLYAWRG